MAQQTLNSNRPPIVWSVVDDAFQRINSNFTELYLSLGGTGADLTNLASTLAPDSANIRDLGSVAKPWRNLFLGTNSVFFGSAAINVNSVGSINLPVNATVNGELIIDPANTGFKSISINAQPAITANIARGNLEIGASGISIFANDQADSLFFQNTGVTSLTATPGLFIDTTSGDITISNTGILSATAGPGILITTVGGAIEIGNTGITNIIPGIGILLSRSGGEVIVTNTSPNISQNTFRTISVTGQVALNPSTAASILTVVPGQGISILSNSTANSITINNTGITNIIAGQGFQVITTAGSALLTLDATLINNLQGDVTGSVFSDSSSLLVDGITSRLVGDVDNNSVSTTTVFGNNAELLITSRDLSTSIKLSDALALEVNAVSGINISADIISGNVVIGNGINSVIIANGSRFDTSIDDIHIIGGVQGQVLSTDGQGNHVWTTSSGSGGSFVFKIAGDDSTQHIINNGETVKIVGTNGISTASDLEGTVVISGEAISSMKSRQPALGSTPSIATDSVENITISGFKSYLLLSLQTSVPARVRIYTSIAARSADSSRTEATPIPINSGIIADIVTLTSATVIIAPGLVGFSSETVPATDIILAITNKSGTTQVVTTTLSILQLEV